MGSTQKGQKSTNAAQNSLTWCKFGKKTDTKRETESEGREKRRNKGDWKAKRGEGRVKHLPWVSCSVFRPWKTLEHNLPNLSNGSHIELGWCDCKKVTHTHFYGHRNHNKCRSIDSQQLCKPPKSEVKVTYCSHSNNNSI